MHRAAVNNKKLEHNALARLFATAVIGGAP
jgi:hypothetical protein